MWEQSEVWERSEVKLRLMEEKIRRIEAKVEFLKRILLIALIVILTLEIKVFVF